MFKNAVIIPVYNEQNYIRAVLYELRAYYDGLVVFVDDGSTDASPQILRDLEGSRVVVLRHAENQGYGASLISAFGFCADQGLETLVTMDCDCQHEPHLVPEFFSALDGWDIVSGSRYLETSDRAAPADRRKINYEITQLINEITGLRLTDGFCGFKALRVEALRRLELDEKGYALPLQFWIQAAAKGLRVREKAVPLIYLETHRSFGGSLDDPQTRLMHYKHVIGAERARWKM